MKEIDIDLPLHQQQQSLNNNKTDKKRLVSEGIIIFNSNNVSEVEENGNKQSYSTNLAEGRDIFLNRMFNLVNQFYWPKSTISSVVYTTKEDSNDVVEYEPLQSKATITELPVSTYISTFPFIYIPEK